MPQTDATHYHSQLGLPEKGPAINWFVVCNSLDLRPYVSKYLQNRQKISIPLFSARKHLVYDTDW